MIPAKILKLLKENNWLNEYFSGHPDVEVIIKKLNENDIKRLFKEYPNLFELDLNFALNKNREHGTNRIPFSIISLTIVKRDLSTNNYLKSRKIRFYIDERNEIIIKILQN